MIEGFAAIGDGDWGFEFAWSVLENDDKFTHSKHVKILNKVGEGRGKGK